MCNHDCFNCQYSDCITDNLTEEERTEQLELDKEIRFERVRGVIGASAKRYYLTDKGRAARERYLKSEKGKAMLERRKSREDVEERKKYFRDYNASERGKERTRRYLESEHGKRKQKERNQESIKSGRNKEACRKYYQTHREEILRRLREKRVGTI